MRRRFLFISWIILTISLGISTSQAQRGNMVDDTLRTKTIFDIGGLVYWPGQEDIDSFVVAQLSPKPDLIPLLEMHAAKGIHGKPVRIVHYKTLKDVEDPHILFFQRKDDYNVQRILDMTEKKPTLLIAENYPFYRSMITFAFDRTYTEYYVFRRLMLQRDFSYHEDLADIAEIKTNADWKRAYKATEKELREKKERLEKQKRELKELQKQVKEKQATLQEQKKAIQEQKKKLTQREEEHKELKKAIQERSSRLEKKKKELTEKRKELEKNKKAIEEQKAILSKQEESIAEHKKEIEQQSSRIRSQKGELKEQTHQIQQQRSFIYLIGTVLLVIAVSAFLLYRNFKKIKRINGMLEEKNQMITERNSRIEDQKMKIEEKNKEITESITYASRIQRAMLPSLEVLDKFFEQRIEIYYPRDIVSGDFYWATEVDGNVVWTAADCTGHGVPGAMMSMLGMAYLKEAVTKKREKDPGTILGDVRSLIVRSLSSSQGEQAKDGMDMGLCSMNPNSGEISFAGANNPAYIFFSDKKMERDLPEKSKPIKNDQDEQVGVEIKPDKQPVGLHSIDEKEFESIRFKVEPGDRIYLFSDGYPDQFGGENGKKLKYGSFKRLLIGTMDRSLEDQKAELEKFFKEWKGNFEQVDDVIILGVEVGSST